MKNLFTTLSILIISLTAQAAPTEGALSVHHVLNEGDATLLLCSWTASEVGQEGLFLCSMGRRVRIVSGSEEYKLLSSIHMPVWDEAEARYAFLQKAGDSVNFVLKFEAFPTDAPFDIVDDSFDGSIFNAGGIRADGTEPVSVDTFLSSTPYVEYGVQVEQGVPMRYYEDDALRLQFYAIPVYESDDKVYQVVGFVVKNKSGDNLQIGPSSLSVSGWKDLSRTKPLRNLEILSEKKADDAWHQKDLNQAAMQEQTTPSEMVGNSLITASLRSSTPALPGLGLFAAGVLINSLSSPDLDSKIVEQNKEREEEMQYYLKDCTVQPGEEMETFVIVKHNKKLKCSTAELKIQDRNYIFNW